MPVLYLKNKKSVVRAMQVFSSRKHVVFNISPDKMTIQTTESPWICVSVPDKLYQIDTAIKFSIDTKALLDNIDKIDSTEVLLENSFKIVKRDEAGAVTAFINILFLQMIGHTYEMGGLYTTRLFVGKEVLKSLIRGTVTYTNEERLVVRKYGGGIEEIMEIDAEYLERGDLYFCCSNDWVNDILSCIDLVTTVLFCFMEGALHVRMSFGNDSGIYLDVSVLEKMRIR